MTANRKTRMAKRKAEALEHDFPKGLAQPALRALKAAGFQGLDQLGGVPEADILRLHGMGPKAIGLLRAALESKGKSFA